MGSRRDKILFNVLLGTGLSLLDALRDRVTNGASTAGERAQDLYDAASLVFSWRWPTTQGEITAVDIERVSQSRQGETWRLAVAFRFSPASRRSGVPAFRATSMSTSTLDHLNT